jgi:hypothetical protein
VSDHSPSPETDEALGLAHVASVSFVGSRLAPSAQFWLALPGGVALARAGALRGASRGYGASTAAMLQGVAILGPLRFNAPLTQAITAPLLGRLEARRAPLVIQLAACLALRLVHYVVLTAFAIWLVLGGLDGYVKTYEATTGWLGFLPQGATGAVVVLVVQQLIAALFFTGVQVLVYRRALRRWPETEPLAPAPATAAPAADDDETEPPPARHDPRALAAAALIAFVLLLVSTRPLVLAGVAAWLAVACAYARPDARVMRIGAGLAALLAASALIGGVIGGLGLESSALRGARAALLVMVASWLRGAAGPEGMRQVFRAVLGRLHRLGWAREARSLLDRLDAARRLADAGRGFVGALRDVPHKPGPVADAATAWVAAEAARGPAAPAPAPAFSIGWRRDGLLVALAATPLLGVLVGS